MKKGDLEIIYEYRGGELYRLEIKDYKGEALNWKEIVRTKLINFVSDLIDLGLQTRVIDYKDFSKKFKKY